MVYNLIAFILSSVAHPAEAAFKIAKMLVQIAHELTKPETYTKTGIGMLGASLGQAAIGNPFSMIGIGIGIALLAVGLSAEMIVAAYKSDRKFDAAFAVFVNCLKKLPEQLLTGFIMGLIFGGIQKAVRDNAIENVKKQRAAKVYSKEELQEIGKKFIKNNKLPLSGTIVEYSDGMQLTSVKYETPEQLEALIRMRPDYVQIHPVMKTHGTYFALLPRDNTFILYNYGYGGIFYPYQFFIDPIPTDTLKNLVPFSSTIVKTK